MNDMKGNFSNEHAVFLQWILEGGNKQVLATLEMLTGRTIEQHSTQITVMADMQMRDLLGLMDFDVGPVAGAIRRESFPESSRIKT